MTTTITRYRGILAFLLLVGSGINASAVEYSMQLPGAATSLLLDIAAAGDRLVAVGDRGHILYSEDQGQNWTQAEVPTTAMLTRVFFYDDKLGWAVGHDGNVMHSHDGGRHWELQRDGLAEQVQINEQRVGRARERVEALREQIAVASETEQEALEDALGEAEWTLEKALETLGAPTYAPPLMDVWFATAEKGWASGAYGMLLHTANGGRSWADWSHNLVNPDELHLNGIAGGSGGSLYIASEWGNIFVSHSGGENWQVVESGYDGSFFGVIASPDSGAVFAYGLLGTIYRSTDRGESWEELDSGVQASLFGGALSDDGALVMVGQGGTATRSDDAGDSFTPLIQPRRDDLNGVTAYPGGGFFITGQGGSKPLMNTAAGEAHE